MRALLGVLLALLLPCAAGATVGAQLPASVTAAAPAFDSHFELVSGSAVGQPPVGWCSHLQSNWSDALPCDAQFEPDGVTPADRFFASELLAATGEVELLTTLSSCPGSLTAQTYPDGLYIHASPLDAAEQAASNCGRGFGVTYGSGVATTRYLYTQGYGYFEADMKVPAGNGSWPTFFLLPANKPVMRTPPAANDNWCELDADEEFNDGTRNGKASQTTHLVDTTYANRVNVITPAPIDTTTFHKFGVLVTATTISFTLDRVITLETPNIGCAGPWYMILYVAVGGTGGTPDNHTTQSMFVRSVKAWAPAQ